MTKDLAYILGSLAYYYREHEYMEKLWVRESEFSNLLDMALEASSKSDKNTMLYEYADYFIGYTCVFFLLSNSDIASLLSRIKNQKKRALFMGLYFSQSLVPHALIENILQDAMLLDQIGSMSEWIEYPVKLRAKKIIMNAERWELGVDMLIPRHIQLAASFEEYLLGWAYEEDKLNVPAVDYFKVRFKNKYQMLEAIKMANDQ